MNFTPDKYLMYLRKSRSDPEDESIEETLSRHKKTLLDFSKTNKLTIARIYEEVVSGDGLFVRPEMIKLLSDIETGEYAGVICMDIDRLGRVDTKDRGIILETFKTHDTKIITPRKIYNLNDELDEFSTEIQMLFARQELKKITQRLQQGVKRTVEDGYHVGEPPYGYRRIYQDKRPTLEICEEEAKIIRLVFDMYVNQGIGSHIIADTLNSMGYKTRKQTAFSRNTIRFFLQNPTYIGKIVWNKRKHLKKKRPTDKHKSKLNPESEWIVSDGVHPPIVDVNIFNRAQEIRKTRTHPPSNTGEVKNPFSGLIRCKNCGQLMSRQTSKKTGPRLLCTKTGCTKSTVLEKVEKSVYQILKNSLQNFENDLKLTETKEYQEKINSINLVIADTKKQLTLIERQRENLHDLLEQGVYDIETFTKRGQTLSSHVSKLQTIIKESKNKLHELKVFPEKEDVLPKLQHLVTHYDKLAPGEKNVLLKELVNCIYYNRDKTPGNQLEVSVVFKKWI